MSPYKCEFVPHQPRTNDLNPPLPISLSLSLFLTLPLSLSNPLSFSLSLFLSLSPSLSLPHLLSACGPTGTGMFKCVVIGPQRLGSTAVRT